MYNFAFVDSRKINQDCDVVMVYNNLLVGFLFVVLEGAGRVLPFT